MIHNDKVGETGLLAAAKDGDGAAFAALTARAQPRLRAVLRRLVGHPDDVDDLIQDTMIKAWSALSGFRGDAAFASWLCGIGARLAIDHLRAQKRWRAASQIAYANACVANPQMGGALFAATLEPGYAYDVKEHIAYCMVCVGRSLPPDEHAAFVARDVMENSTREAADMLGISQSVLRHRLSAARSRMTGTYEGLCALVNKNGVCYQCAGLRDIAPEAARGEEPPENLTMAERCAIAGEADLEGPTRPMHDTAFRHTAEIEKDGSVSDVPNTDCRRPEDAGQ